MLRHGATEHVHFLPLLPVNWPLITTDSVLAYAHEARVRAPFVQQSREEEGAGFGFIRDGVVARIRLKVGQRNPLDADPGRVPPEFAELAALLCLSHVLARLGVLHSGAEGGVFTLTSEQRDRIRQAERDLDAVANGTMTVTASDNPAESPEVSGGAAVEVVEGGVTRVLARGSTSGL